MNTFDVAVIGAGMAGLAAARRLAVAGLRVVVLEAQGRVGGRILTVRAGDEVIELGAEFVHGRPAELLALIEEAGLELYERTGDFLRLDEGRLVSEQDGEDEDEDPVERLKSYPGPDVSFAEYVAGLGLGEEQRAEALAYVEGFNAADAREASVLALGRQQEAEDAIEGDRVARVKEGYDRVPEFLAERFRAAGGRLELNAAVEAVEWSPGAVRVRTAAGEFLAGKAVVTLPLGVLQAGVVRFEPAPGEVLEIAKRMRMGAARRVTLVFARRLWPEGMSFLLTRELLPSVWWTAHPAESFSLTGWVGGPRAAELAGLNERELGQRGCEALAEALEMTAEDVQAVLTEAYAHEWEADAWARGAYSWVPVGGLDAPQRMTEPVENTLFFAGEHTDKTGHWGTVHAALRTGIRAAEQVLGVSPPAPGRE